MMKLGTWGCKSIRKGTSQSKRDPGRKKGLKWLGIKEAWHGAEKIRNIKVDKFKIIAIDFC